MGAPKTDMSAIKIALNRLDSAGWKPYAVDQHDDEVNVNSVYDAVKHVMEVDEAFVLVQHRETGKTGWVFFVLGNDPEEVICNHTVNLSEVLDPLMEEWE